MITNCQNRSNTALAVTDSDSRKSCAAPEPGKAILSCGAGAVGPLPILEIAGARIRNQKSRATLTKNKREKKEGRRGGGGGG